MITLKVRRDRNVEIRLSRPIDASVVSSVCISIKLFMRVYCNNVAATTRLGEDEFT